MEKSIDIARSNAVSGSYEHCSENIMPLNHMPVEILERNQFTPVASVEPAALNKQIDLPKSKIIRLGIIGFGHIGRHHLQAAQSNPELNVVAIAEPNEACADNVPDTIAKYSDWQKLLEQQDLDAVSVCVPHNLHAPITMAALAAGKHVLVEKPLALTVEEGQTLIDYARKYERTLMVELTHRFYPVLREARAFVSAGHLGTIYAVEDRIVESAGAQIQNWLKTKALAGGGVALTNGVHMLDRIASITGQALTFHAGTAGYTAGHGDIEDTAAMFCTLENGAPVQMLASWPKGNSNSDDELTVYGTKGTLRVWAWSGWSFEPLDTAQPGAGRLCYAETDDIGVRIQSGVYNALDEFVASIQENRMPDPTAEAALISQQLIEEFYRFVEKNRR